MARVKFRVLALSMLACGLLSTSCTKSTPGPSTPMTKSIPLSNTLTIETVGENMMYDKKDLYAKAGKPLTLTFTNNASSMKHNWVLTNPGKDEKVGMDGIKAGEGQDFVSPSPDVLAHTKLIGKGQDTVNFTVARAGNYPFICTFPGHYTVMKGTLHVVP